MQSRIRVKTIFRQDSYVSFLQKQTYLNMHGQGSRSTVRSFILRRNVTKSANLFLFIYNDVLIAAFALH
jgi:hypothetical protein